MTQMHLQSLASPPGFLTSLAGVHVLALPAENSLDFLEAAFDCYRRGQVFAIMRGDIEPGRYGLTLSPSPLPGARKGWGRLEYRADLSDRPAQIVFTSGTEGHPKAIVISHRNLADVTQRLNAAMGVTEVIREYIGVPVTYSFGLGRARAVAAAAGAFYLPERFDPSEIRQMLEAGQINAISAVPSLWQAVLALPEAMGTAGARVRWIEIGSQFMSGPDKEAMKRMFPNARILQHYGLTEASRSTFLYISETEGAGLNSVDEGSGSVEIRITDEGAIAIRGDHVAMGRLDETGGVIPLTEGGWLTTRDRGEIREGQLYYLGSLDDQINVAGIKLGSEALEAEIAALVPGASGHFAIAPIPDRMRGEAVLLAIEAGIADHGGLLAEATRLVLERHGIATSGNHGALKRMTLDALPRTGTNKIQRREIARLYQPEEVVPTASPEAMVHSLTAAEARIAKSWGKVLGDSEIAPQQSFFDLGGDSLSSVQVGLVMESAGFARPAVHATLAGRSLAEVASLSDSAAGEMDEHVGAHASLPERTLRNWGLSIASGIMVLSVLLSHWGPGFFARLGIERQAEAVLSFFYRMGTPGFAAVFGIGIGFFMLADFDQKRDIVLARTRSAFRLVAGGLVLLALTKLMLALLKGEAITGIKLGQAFYGVLAYYCVMLGTARWWLRAPIVPLLVISLGSWLSWQITGPLIGPAQWHNPLEWLRLMLQSGYNVFKMSSVAAAGAAVGYWLAREEDAFSAGRKLLVTGALGAVFSLFAMAQSKGLEVFLTRGGEGIDTSLPGLAFYLSLAMLFMGGGIALLRHWADLPGGAAPGFETADRHRRPRPADLCLPPVDDADPGNFRAARPAGQPCLGPRHGRFPDPHVLCRAAAVADVFLMKTIRPATI